MKKEMAILVLGSVLGASAYAEPVTEGYEMREPRNLRIQGTLDRVESGRIYIRTPDGPVVQLPASAVRYDAQRTALFVEDLALGSELDLRIPRRGLRVVSRDGDLITLGNYNGVIVIPETLWTRWMDDDRGTATDDDELDFRDDRG